MDDDELEASWNTRPASPVVSADAETLADLKSAMAELVGSDVKTIELLVNARTRRLVHDAGMQPDEVAALRDRAVRAESEVERLRNAKVVSAPETGAEAIFREGWHAGMNQVDRDGDNTSDSETAWMASDARASLSGSGKEKA